MKDIDKINKSLKKIMSNPENMKLIGGNTNTIIKGNENLVVYGDYYLNSKNIVRPKVECPPGSITEEQIKKIDDLIKEVAEIESKAGLPKGQAIGKWRKKYKDKFKLLGYRCLPAEKFDEAISWLLQSRARLQPKLRRRDNTQWRNNRYKGIFARAKELGITKEQIIMIANKKFNKNIKSIKELGEQNLDKLYRYIFSL